MFILIEINKVNGDNAIFKSEEVKHLTKNLLIEKMKGIGYTFKGLIEVFDEEGNPIGDKIIIQTYERAGKTINLIVVKGELK